MQRIIFSNHKQRIAEFDVEDMQFEHQEEGLLLSAHGSMIAQDTQAVEALVQVSATCHVTINKDNETVIDQSFQVTFFTFEPDTLIALLQ